MMIVQNRIWVAASLFADGAAAAVLQVSGEGLGVIGSFSTLFEDSEDVMGWDVVNTGLKGR
jgi:alkylresorcinol/alkylpyrone synthase